jgi:hypothetical protein
MILPISTFYLSPCQANPTTESPDFRGLQLLVPIYRLLVLSLTKKGIFHIIYYSSTNNLLIHFASFIQKPFDVRIMSTKIKQLLSEALGG